MNTQTLFFTAVLSLLMVLTACDDPQSRFSAAKMMDQDEQYGLIEKTIRYAGHLAPRADHQTKFNSEFDDHYQSLATIHRLEFLSSRQSEGGYYFLMTRPAPSRFERRVAIAGQLELNDAGELVHYEEIFRTWKMAPDELMEKSAMLFGRMMRGEDLSRYYPEQSEGEEYIEFPDAATWYDAEARRWQTSRIQPAEQFRAVQTGDQS